MQMASSTDAHTAAATLLCGTRSSTLSNLLEVMCKSQGILPATTSQYVTLNPSVGPVQDIDIAALGGGIVDSLGDKLYKEICMAYFILDEDPAITQTIDKWFNSEVVWQKRPYEDFYPSGCEILDECEMGLKARIVWYTYELNRCQLRILELAQSGKIELGRDGLVKISPISIITERAAAYLNPLFKQSLVETRKPCNINFEIFIHLKGFVFNKTNINPAARIELMNSLEERQIRELLSDPQDFFFRVVQWLGMSAQEFINACFKYGKDGSYNHLMTTWCPCGVQLEESGPCVKNHTDRCGFTDFVRQRCPDILEKGYYYPNPARKMGSKETAYVMDVINKRLPKDERKKTFVCGNR